MPKISNTMLAIIAEKRNEILAARIADYVKMLPVDYAEPLFAVLGAPVDFTDNNDGLAEICNVLKYTFEHSNEHLHTYTFEYSADDTATHYAQLLLNNSFDLIDALEFELPKKQLLFVAMYFAQQHAIEVDYATMYAVLECTAPAHAATDALLQLLGAVIDRKMPTAEQLALFAGALTNRQIIGFRHMPMHYYATVEAMHAMQLVDLAAGNFTSTLSAYVLQLVLFSIETNR